MTEISKKRRSVDVGGEPVSAVYAKALLGAAEARGEMESVLEEFGSLISDVFDKLPQFEATLASLRLDHDRKVALLDTVFQGRMNPLLLNFLKVGSQHGRLDCLRAIYRRAERLAAEMQGRVEVQLATARPINESLKQQIAAIMQNTLGCPVDMVTEIREDLIGGMVVRVGDSVYDASVVNQLKRMREKVMVSTNEVLKTGLDRISQEGTRSDQ
jgi:F-type H+-transporting ATPase subunit delta